MATDRTLKEMQNCPIYSHCPALVCIDHGRICLCSVAGPKIEPRAVVVVEERAVVCPSFVVRNRSEPVAEARRWIQFNGPLSGGVSEDNGSISANGGPKRPAPIRTGKAESEQIA